MRTKKFYYMLFCALLFSNINTLVAQNTGINIGDKAPEIREKSLSGNSINLSDYKGNYVLIDFWASWCGPCKQDRPRIVGVYNQFKDQTFIGGGNLKIFSVSLDKNQAAWSQGVQSMDMSWPGQVSDLQGWTSVWANVYGVRSIPCNFLVDQNGVIVAKNLKGDMLTSFLEKHVER
ncbi:MAG: TlpA family protein disulfide reductase [Bacteroidales bacterium]